VTDARLDHVLNDLRDFCRQAERLVAQGKDRFDSDEFLQLASEALILNLGEAVNRLPADYVAQHPEAPWRAISGTRTIVAHPHHRVNHAIIWNGLRDGLGELRTTLGIG
jgi:uncharacterized protein with HEPN domain